MRISTLFAVLTLQVFGAAVWPQATAGQELCYPGGGTTPGQNYTITYVQQ